MSVKKKFSKKIRLRFEVCSTCMKMCRDVCPTAIATASESFTPYIRTLMVNLNEKGIRSYDEGALDLIFSCLTCNLCNSYCLPKVSVEELIKISRRAIVDAGFDVTKYSKISNNIKKFYNPLGENNTERYKKLGNPAINNNSNTLLFFGCMSSFREVEIGKSSMRLLEKFGIEYTVMKEEKCCGSPAISTGFLDTAFETMNSNYKEWKERGIKKVITPCSACYRIIKSEYPKYIENFDIQVYHMIDIIKSNIEKIQLNKLNSKIAFHDPCHLGRAMDVYDKPREIIKKIPNISYVEMTNSREKSVCCGAGGGVRVNFPDIASEVGKNRVKEFHEAGVEYLISACPLCKYHFKNSENIGEIKVLDIVELINDLILNI
ncbi:MAG: (Fe-S)-binding protein [Candidatus Helarchaeota archaeon]